MIAQHNVRLYYLLTVLSSCAFMSGNWIFFWLKFMSYSQLGIIDSLGFAFGMLMEIPTGAISDMVGKRYTLIMAMLAHSVGWVVMGLSRDITALVVGFLLAQIGWAFYSGAAEALVYDSLKQEGQAARFQHVMSRGHMIGLVTLVITALLGGLLYHWDVRAPHVGFGIAFGFGVVVAWFLVEPALESQPFSFANYRRQLVQGYQQLRQPALRPYFPLILGTLGVAYLYSNGLVQPAVATSFGFFADEQALIYPILTLSAAAIIHYLPTIRRYISDWRAMQGIALMMALGFGLAALPLGYAGFGVLFLLRTMGWITSPWMSVIVNQAIDSDVRATTLSTVALLSKLPYVVTAIIAGYLIDRGQLEVFVLGVAAVVLLTVGWTFIKWPQSAAPAIDPLVECA